MSEGIERQINRIGSLNLAKDSSFDTRHDHHLQRTAENVIFTTHDAQLTTDSVRDSQVFVARRESAEAPEQHGPIDLRGISDEDASDLEDMESNRLYPLQSSSSRYVMGNKQEQAWKWIYERPQEESAPGDSDDDEESDEEVDDSDYCHIIHFD
ncbi:hypothetical protein PM082_009922 [Marasmius tenuissimus]|nr:hypothetical protein PM082_009922 [Marasmius tenuissimus]